VIDTSRIVQRDVLDYYRQPTPMSAAGSAAPRFADLPSDVESLMRIVQGLGLYDGVARDFYGFDVPAERADEIHIRSIEQMLERILADGRPLAVARSRGRSASAGSVAVVTFRCCWWRCCARRESRRAPAAVSVRTSDRAISRITGSARRGTRRRPAGSSSILSSTMYGAAS
jgi:hypothetical protein